MSIIIKGMEMPKGFEMLVVFSDGTVHKCLPGMREHIEKGTAVPVPPHGGLIDADKLLQFHGVLDDGIYYPDAYIPATAIKTAPTIIPAEED